MQNDDQNSLIKNLKDFLPKTVITNKNKFKSWDYGYNEKYDFIVISKSGQIQDIVEIEGIKIALPKPPKKYIQIVKNNLNNIGSLLNIQKNYKK